MIVSWYCLLRSMNKISSLNPGYLICLIRIAAHSMYAYNLVLAAVATDNLAVWKRNKLLSIWIITPAVQSELFTPMGLESRMKQTGLQPKNASIVTIWVKFWVQSHLPWDPEPWRWSAFLFQYICVGLILGIAKYSETRINTSLLFQIPTWWCSQRRISWVASWWLLITAVLQICFLWLPDRLGRLGRGIYRVAEAREPRWNLVKFEDVCMYVYYINYIIYIHVYIHSKKMIRKHH